MKKKPKLYLPGEFAGIFVIVKIPHMADQKT